MPAMRSSAPALSASCSSLATPPSSHRLMPSYTDALPPGDQGVADLVGEERHEEHERPGDAGDPVGAVALAGDRDREPVLGQRERVEQGDERHGHAHADPDPGDAPQRNVPTHAGRVPVGSVVRPAAAVAPIVRLCPDGTGLIRRRRGADEGAATWGGRAWVVDDAAR